MITKVTTRPTQAGRLNKQAVCANRLSHHTPPSQVPITPSCLQTTTELSSQQDFLRVWSESPRDTCVKCSFFASPPNIESWRLGPRNLHLNEKLSLEGGAERPLLGSCSPLSLSPPLPTLQRVTAPCLPAGLMRAIPSSQHGFHW